MDKPQSLPHSVDAEKGLLSSLMLDVQALAECKSTPPGAFYIPAHQTIFEMLVEINNLGRSIDFASLRHYLKEHQRLEDIGGVEELSAIWEFVPSPANWKFYLDIVLDRHQRRVSISACQKITSAMHDVLSDSSESIREHSERALTQLAIQTYKPENTFKEKVLQTVDELNSLSENVAKTGAIFGIKRLDEFIFGMLPAELWVVAAETSQGKSAIAMQAALCSSLDRSLYSVIFSLEMQASELIKRMMSRQGSVSMKYMRNGLFPERDYAKLAVITGILCEAPMQVYDDYNLDWKGIVTQCRKKQVQLSRTNGKIGLIVIDYIQLVDGDGDAERKELEISKIVKSAKSLAKEMACPVLAISQLNDNGKLYGARSIKHHADGLLLLKPPLKSDEEGRVDVCVAKMRNGQRDVRIPLLFSGQYMDFESVPPSVVS